ncbi:MAG: CPBP family intramembrane metalloprotease [Flavobacteriales bacterium]|nr:CPBP family intramembrane metalloprotease [Flavobacteriales bacterium]MCB9364452.1 CPBP family intramembrane metalloprotease [Flavobacteriales bacterium]
MTSNSSVFSKPSIQLFLIVGLCLVSALIFSLLGGLAVILFYGFDMSSFYDYSNPNTIEGLKLFQLLSSVGLFIVPPVVYALITSKTILPTLNLNTISKPINWLLVLLIMIVASPLMSWVVEVNAQMSLPEFMSPIEEWMKQSEASAEVLTKAFIRFDGLPSLFYILLIVAVIPAVGEELLFRGVLQKILEKWTQKPHLAIWLTAILFSALHMQFFGFFPRLLLGALFGYLLVWSGSLWLPILGHFINNGSVVVLSYLYPELMENTEINVFNEDGKTWLPTLISMVLVVGGIYLFKKLNTQKLETDN